MKTSRRTAFTLLELLLVVLILAMLAATTSSMVDNVHDQARYDETGNRLEQLRRAIVGPDDHRVRVSGYVADMGARPSSIRDLLINPNEPNGRYQVDAVTGVGHGWRGPYLHALPARDGTLKFPDGWGNPDDPTLPVPPGDPNFGWIWSEDGAAVDGPALQVRSHGLSTATAADDQQLSIMHRTHHVDVGPWQVRVIFNNTAGTPISPSVALRLWFPHPDGSGALTELTGEGNDLTLDPGPNPPATLRFDTTFDTTLGQSVEPRWVPHGIRAVEIVYLTPAPQDLDERQPVLIELRGNGDLPLELERRIDLDGAP